MFLNTSCQAAGLSEGRISAPLKLQSKFGALMKELHKESKESKVNPEEKWKLWVNLKVKMMVYNENWKVLQDLRRDREAEKYG